MAFNFPASPSNGDTYTANGFTYEWDGSKWIRKSPSTGAQGSTGTAGSTGIPSGFIGLWSGSANNIPSGWYLCNGGNSTPDLRSKFIIGASGVGSGGYQVGAQGGAETDTVNISISGTTGTDNSAGNGPNYVHAGSGTRVMHTHSFSGSGSDTVDTIPPYYALCYIMKG